MEFETAAAAATGTEASNAKGLSADLHTMADDDSVPKEVRERLAGLADQVGKYAQQLSDRDKKLVSAIKTVSRAPSPNSEPVIGWVYLGRHASTGAWAPKSDKVSANAESDELKIERDVVLVDRDPSETSSPFAGTESKAQTIRLIRSGTVALKILSRKQSPSISEGKFEWARVEVSPSDLYEVKRGDTQ